jgi:hypothetical protein
MSLIKMIAQYDADREDYIADLERQLKEEKARCSQLLNLALDGVRDREKATFELIMNGSLRLPTKKEASNE